jgi:DNA-directed RNA polymerase subunit RPC12/RpoP
MTTPLPQDKHWDYKCTLCNWKGTVDECDMQNEGGICCPVCGDNELEMRDK